jgi:hypothetical protein
MKVQEATIDELDEAISHFYAKLKDDRYGNRLNWRQKKEYWETIDDLLDARNALVGENRS